MQLWRFKMRCAIIRIRKICDSDAIQRKANER